MIPRTAEILHTMLAGKNEDTRQCQIERTKRQSVLIAEQINASNTSTPEGFRRGLKRVEETQTMSTKITCPMTVQKRAGRPITPLQTAEVTLSNKVPYGTEDLNAVTLEIPQIRMQGWILLVYMRN
jgi:hypothetical protein